MDRILDQTDTSDFYGLNNDRIGCGMNIFVVVRVGPLRSSNSSSGGSSSEIC